MKRTFLPGLMAIFAMVGIAGCGDRAEVVDSQTDLHLSGNWNDSDSRVVSEALAHAVGEAPWVAEFRERMGRAPVLRIGRIHVRTRALDDVVEPKVFTNDIERALIVGGQVRVVAGRRETAIQGEERTDVAKGSAQPIVKDGGLAADVVLTGTLLTQDDRVLDKGVTGTYRQVKFYQLDVAVSDLTSTEILWRGSVERKKTIEQSTVGW